MKKISMLLVLVFMLALSIATVSADERHPEGAPPQQEMQQLPPQDQDHAQQPGQDGHPDQGQQDPNHADHPDQGPNQ